MDKMHVKKFVGSTMEETLTQIKKEFGPDAIILKTSSSGIGSKFKKKKIEITAAINEESYLKKIKTERVFSDEQKEEFHKNSSQTMKKTIERYNQSYEMKEDAALEKSEKNNNILAPLIHQEKDKNKISFDEFIVKPQHEEVASRSFISSEQETNKIDNRKEVELEKKIKYHVEEIEDKIYSIEKKVSSFEEKIKDISQLNDDNLRKIKKIMTISGIEGHFIEKTIRKMIFSHSDKDLLNFDFIYDQMLLEMENHFSSKELNVFSKNKDQQNPPILLLFSDAPCGQNTIFYKTCQKSSSANNHLLIQNENDYDSKENFAIEKILQLKVEKGKNTHDIISLIRKNKEVKKEVIINYRLDKQKLNNNQKDDLFFLIDSIKESHSNVQVVFILSALYSQDYIELSINQFRKKIDGLIFTFLDKSPGLANIFNSQLSFPEIPIMGFSTGPTIPADLETATFERLISGILHL